MQFLIIAYDGTDEGAPGRRLAVREAHLANARRLAAEGRIIEGGAILDEEGRMIGSAVFADFPSRAALDDWLRSDPYVTGDVWRTIEVRPLRLAPLRGGPPAGPG
jgi:uncharacterized protein YciI